jgi:hypothetical protein
MFERCLNLGHDRFHLDPLWFDIRFRLVIRRYIVRVTDSVAEETNSVSYSLDARSSKNSGSIYDRYKIFFIICLLPPSIHSLPS